MNKFLILIPFLLSACNAETMKFVRTMEEQQALGYKWKKIPCRQVTLGVPAITMDTNDRKIVCNLLVKE